jgi:hypothetical protein
MVAMAFQREVIVDLNAKSKGSYGVVPIEPMRREGQHFVR